MAKEIKQLKTKEEFFDKLYEYYREGGDAHFLDDIHTGKYEGEDFLIVHNHETLVSLGAWINGYEGDLDLAVVWGFESLNSELDKAEKELESVNPEHLGTKYRLEKRIKQLLNLSTYLRWIEANELETVSLDDLGIEVGFSDEYDRCCGSCNGCENIVRTSPDSYSWTPPLYVDCEGYACDECAPDYSEYVLEEFCNVAKSIPDQFDTGELGLVQINEDSFQNGMHYGMDDSPEPIIKKMNEAGIDVWFKVHPSQFYIDFDVYVREADKDKAVEVLSNTDTYQGHSTAGNLEKGLREASKQMGELQGEGVRYSKVNADGTAETRLVSKEEFIKGIKD